jgi:pimeloyl-ACP methyl ester carboxylesterase
MGAAIAAEASRTASGRVSALVLAAPVGFAGVRGMRLFRLLTPAFALSIFPLLARRFLVRGMLSVVYGSLRRPSKEDVEEFFAPIQTRGATTALRHLLHVFDWRRPFPKLSMPWMIIVGGEDILSPPSDLGRYAGRDGLSTSLVIEGAGHVVFDEAPEIVNAAVCEFIIRNPPAYISGQNEQTEDREEKRHP